MSKTNECKDKGTINVYFHDIWGVVGVNCSKIFLNGEKIWVSSILTPYPKLDLITPRPISLIFDLVTGFISTPQSLYKFITTFLTETNHLIPKFLYKNFT